MEWRKKTLKEDLTEDKYFDDEDSNNIKIKQSKPIEQNEEIDEDPLDAYMKGLETTIKTENNQPKVKFLNKKSITKLNKKNIERLIEEDPLESYMDDMKKKLIKDHNKKKENDSNSEGYSSSGENEEENNNQYDFLNSDGEIDFEAIRKQKKKKIEPLPNLDHSSLKYDQFSKNFYDEHDQIKNLTVEKVRSLREEMDMKVKGESVPNPIISFGHLNFDENMIHQITKQGFEKPTPIQCQALPCCLSGRDVIGVAKTGSGKTLAYIWPLLVHILDQKELQKNEGPIGVILCPTRELTQQVYLEAKKYARLYNISIAALLGGESKHEQWKELKAGVEILIATPGRMIEMIKKKATNLRRCTYVVIDEADKMFGMGFEYQIRSIVGQIRPDRQTLLFTATFRKKIQNLALDLLTNPIVINVGKDNQANEVVTQEVIVVNSENQKFLWLITNLPSLLSHGKVLIFVNQIKKCQELNQDFKSSLGVEPLVLHGDKLQQERTQIINEFKNNKNLLIATDVASRGLDVPSIRTVINYECPRDGDTHIHRVGRTGRAGNKDGMAYTLIMKNDIKFAIILIKNLEISGQKIPYELEEIAMNDDGFKRGKMATKLGLKKSNNTSKLIEKALKRGNKSTAGLGYIEKNILQEQELKNAFKKEMMTNFESKNRIQVNNSNPISNLPAPNKCENEQILIPTREDIREKYTNSIKNTMQMQFRSNFTSAGSFQVTKTVSTVSFIGKNSKNEESEKKTTKPTENINKKRNRWDN